MRVPFVDLGAQYRSIRDEVDRAIQGVIESTAFIKGRFVREFEESFARFLGGAECVGVGNGTDALTIALKGLGIGAGDEVITAVNSFIATSEAISATGARVVFSDIEAATYNLDPALIEERITERTRAIVPVHLYGRVAQMDRISAIARAHDLLLVEDAAQAHGARWAGQAAGTLGQAGCFSFYPGKNLGAYGDAGAIVTPDHELATRVRMYADHGRLEKYEHLFEGMNSRLDGLQAAILSAKLPHLADWVSRRYRHAAAYNRLLAGLDPVVCPDLPPEGQHVFHLFVVRVPRREELRQFLKARGIATGVHYPQILSDLPAYRALGYDRDEFPVARAYRDQILSLPIFPEATSDQQEYVVECLHEFF